MSTQAIRSDDAQAADKIRERIAAIAAQVENWKQINAAWRKHGKPDVDNHEAWARIAQTPGIHAEWNVLRVGMTRDPLYRPGRPRPPIEAWAISNANANRRRLELRLAEIEAKDEARAQHGDQPETLHSGPDWSVCSDYGDNRIRIVFRDKPDAETRAVCKRHGFRWAPSQGAWQRQLNNAGHSAASAVADYLRKEGRE